jgi:uncharacterized protein
VRDDSIPRTERLAMNENDTNLSPAPPELAITSTPAPLSRPLPFYWRVLRYPLTRLVIGTIACLIVPQIGLVAVLVGYDVVILHQAPNLTGEAPLDVLLVGECVQVAIALPMYVALAWLIEWRRPAELGTRRAVGEYVTGLAIGAGLMAAVIGCLTAMGVVDITGGNSPTVMLMPLGLALIIGIVEELVARGIWFRIIEEWIGSDLALFVSSLLFGLAHAFNPGATLFSCVAIALEAGLLLSAAFMLTRRLWLAMGIHAGWNFTQGGVFGARVSGQDWPGWLNLEPTGPDWLTGGKFGPEASPVTLLICTVAGIVLLVMAIRRGSRVPLFSRPQFMPIASSTVENDHLMLLDTHFLPAADRAGPPAAAENQAEGPADRPADDGTNIIHEA